MSQATLAGVLHLTRASVTNLEAGRQHPQAHQIVMLASALQTDPGNLIGTAELSSRDAQSMLHDQLFEMAKQSLAEATEK
jgi:transcriptional regulator with XRE-family HTH domain